MMYADDTLNNGVKKPQPWDEDPYAQAASTVAPVPPQTGYDAPADDGTVRTQPQPVDSPAPAPVVQYQQPASAPAPAPTGFLPAAQPQAVDPFAANGGGKQLANGDWVPSDHPLAQQQGATGATGAGSPVTTSPSIDAQARTVLMDLLKTPTTITPEALNDHPAVQAMRMQEQRSEERQRRQMAERADLEGWSDSGGFDSGLAGIREKRGMNEANFVGNLATQQLRDNRDTLFNALQLATQQGQFDKAQQLQRELASIDAALRQAGIASSETMSNNRLGYDYTALQAQLDRDALLAALGAGG